jgi:hypothetical protein
VRAIVLLLFAACASQERPPSPSTPSDVPAPSADPNVRGRVVVKFVIDRNGAVSTAQDAGSTLPDQDVINCVVRSFGNLSFPQPEGGIVTATYPFVFP